MIAVVEMPLGTTLKYEQDKLSGVLLVDRVINQEIPFNYGYLTGTLSEDGDPLDVFILADMPIHPLAHVNVEVVGILKCLDNGVEDDKILATIVGYPDRYQDHSIRMIVLYLTSYKSGFQVLEHLGAEQALECIKVATARYYSVELATRCLRE